METHVKNVVIVRLGGEIGIKSRPVRREYEMKVLRHIENRLRAQGIQFSRSWREAGRIFIATGDAERASELIARTFGVSSASAGVLTTSELDDIIGMSLRLSGDFRGSFAVKCRRAGKHPYTSQEVAAMVGEQILRIRPYLRVDLENPDHVLYLEIRDENAVFYAKSIRGPDGFPFGTQDPVVGVVDDTFDSLVASWCIMKRGSPVIAAAARYGEDLNPRVTRNLSMLSRWSPDPFRAVIFPLPAGDVDPILHLFLASAYSKSRGILAVVSGMPVANLAALSGILSALPVPALFPLVSIDETTLKGWADLLELDPGKEVRYLAAAGHMETPSGVDVVLKDSIEVTVREDGSFSPL